MNTQANIQPQPNLIGKFLILTFAITWGSSMMVILLKNSPIMPLFAYVGGFGPMLASLIVLKKRSFRAIIDFLFSGKKQAWLYLFIYGGALTVISALAASGKLLDSALAELPMGLITLLIGGGNEESGWRGFLQPALEKKFSFPVATVIVGIVWAVWHAPLWFLDRGESSFPLFFVMCLVFAVWLAGLYKRT